MEATLKRKFQERPKIEAITGHFFCCFKDRRNNMHNESKACADSLRMLSPFWVYQKKKKKTFFFSFRNIWVWIKTKIYFNDEIWSKYTWELFILSIKKNHIYIYIIKLFYSLVRSFNFYGYQGIVDENRNVGIFITSYVTLEFETNLNPASKCQLLQSSI